MDRAARPVERCRLVLAGELVDELAPLGRTLPVARARARRDQVAVRLGERVDVADAAGRCRGHRFLEEPHALIPASCAHLGAPEQADGEHLEVVSVRLTCDLQRPACVLGTLLDRFGVPRALHRDPALSGAQARVLHCALGTRKPAARSRGPSADEVLVRDPDRQAGSVVAAPGVHIPFDSALARGDSSTHIAEEPERETEPVERFRCLLVPEDGLERLPSHIPPCRFERALALVRPGVAYVIGHRLAIVGAEPASVDSPQ